MTLTIENSQIGPNVVNIDTWSTRNATLNDEFDYIDIASVDRDKKAVTATTRMNAKEAPSRARQIVKPGDILVSTVRPNLNAVALVPQKLTNAIASTGFCVLRCHPKKLDYRYLFHWVRTDHFVSDMVRQATGASYPAVSDRIIKESKIPLPPLSEQKRIADILDKADAVRRKRRETDQQAEAIKMALFYEQFGNPATNPMGWNTGTLGDLIHTAKDGPHVSPEYASEGIPFLSTRNIRPGRLIWEDLKYISLAEADRQWRKCKPEYGDILYTKGGTTGYAKCVDFHEEFAVWVHVAVLKTNIETTNPLWLETMLNTPFCYSQSQRHTRGIVNRDLGLTRMVNIEVLKPPKKEQDKFEQRIKAVMKMDARMKKSASETDDLFNSLVQRAFKGEL